MGVGKSAQSVMQHMSWRTAKLWVSDVFQRVAANGRQASEPSTLVSLLKRYHEVQESDLEDERISQRPSKVSVSSYQKQFRFFSFLFRLSWGRSQLRAFFDQVDYELW